MITVRSYDTANFAEPMPVRVVRVLPQAGFRARQYAWVEVEGVDGVGYPYAMTVRGRRGWRLPKPGHEQEMVAWRVRDPERDLGGDHFEEPGSGAIVCYLAADAEAAAS